MTEIQQRKTGRITPLGRRILSAQLRRAKTLDEVGYLALAQQLFCEQQTALRLLTADEPSAFTTKGAWAHLTGRICEVFKVTRVWLFDIRVEGDTSESDWVVRKRQVEIV